MVVMMVSGEVRGEASKVYISTSSIMITQRAGAVSFRNVRVYRISTAWRPLVPKKLTLAYISDAWIK